LTAKDLTTLLANPRKISEIYYAIKNIRMVPYVNFLAALKLYQYKDTLKQNGFAAFISDGRSKITKQFLRMKK